MTNESQTTLEDVIASIPQGWSWEMWHYAPDNTGAKVFTPSVHEGGNEWGEAWGNTPIATLTLALARALAGDRHG